MAGAFSGHLLDSFEAANSSGAPFGQTSSTNSTHGAMSFNQSHGNQPSTRNDSQSLFQHISDATTLKISNLQAKLNQKLGPEYISQRPGPGGGKLTYAEGWKMINLANEVFGFNGWSSNVVNLTTDYIDFIEESKKFNVGVTAIVRVTLRDGVFHEDIGYGILENSKSKGAALDKCKKEAVTDALKRCLRNYGNLLGNCLYDKSYTQEIVKIKVPAPKFDKSQLYRRPEFDQSKQPQPVPSTSTTSPMAKHPAKPLSSIPPHMRSGATPNAQMNSHNSPPPPYNQNSPRTNPPAQIQTPVRAQARQQLQQALPQLQHRSPQRVSFASPTRDPDESFSYSDDDAFLAQVDLGEGDIGRPIDYEGTGDVIVVADTNVGRNDLSSSDTATASMGTKATSCMGPPEIRTGPSNANVRTGATSVQQRQGTNSTSTSNSSHDCIQNANLSHSATSYLNPASTSNTSTSHVRKQNSNPSVAGPAPRTADFTPQSTTVQHHHHQQHHVVQSSTNSNPSSNQKQAGAINRPIQNQNQAPHSNTNINVNTNSASTSAAKRPVTPSMGGFHFPPGVNPLSTTQPPPPILQRGSVQSTSAPAFSLKRSADAMNASSANSRRSMQGMGLAQQQQQQQSAPVKREPFARLEVGEGGDIKRVKF